MSRYFVDFDECDFNTWVEVETDDIENYIVSALAEMYEKRVYNKPAPGDTHKVEYAPDHGVKPGYTPEFAKLCQSITVDVSDLGPDEDDDSI